MDGNSPMIENAMPKTLVNQPKTLGQRKKSTYFQRSESPFEFLLVS